MRAIVKPRMDADEFLAWAAAQASGRYELSRGEVVAMAPERAIHVEVKMLIWLALRNAVQAAGLGCAVFGDGLSVRIDAETVYEPDALLRHEAVPDDTVEIDDPMIVVEVTSPSSSSIDPGVKLVDYFRLPTLRHYSIVDTRRRTLIVHGRSGDRIETRSIGSGPIPLEPPGIVFTAEDCFPG